MRWLLPLLVAGCANTATSTQEDAGQLDRGRDPPGTRNVDMIVVVDNANSMYSSYFLASDGISTFVQEVLRAPAADVHERSAQSIHVGIVSTDLGAVQRVNGCSFRNGDDAVFNPARYGMAQRSHFGRPGPRYANSPSWCADVDGYPRWFSLDSGSSDVNEFSRDLSCVMNLGNLGCEFQQPLEAALRRARAESSLATSLDGSIATEFLRADSILVILVLTDEDDGSIRDCQHAGDDTSSCADATSVGDYPQAQWSSAFPEQRLLFYSACSGNDPTWNLNRYHDPERADRGFLAAKPGHPERVIFMVGAGLPLPIPVSSGGAEGPDWNALLGQPGPSGQDTFCSRQGTTAYRATDDVGPVTMRPAVPHPDCSEQLMPACRRRNDYHTSSCEPERTFSAYPARRLVEIARRFDESLVCNGLPCRNGLVFSICETDYRPAMQRLAARVRQRIAGASP